MKQDEIDYIKYKIDQEWKYINYVNLPSRQKKKDKMITFGFGLLLGFILGYILGQLYV